LKKQPAFKTAVLQI